MRALLVAALLIASVSSLWADTWEISADGLGDAPTIQAGIDSAAVGDTVLVGPGTYSENIDFLGKDVVVRSLMGPAQTTISSPAQGDYVVRFESGETRSATLQGFTLTNGKSGVRVFISEPSILDNVIMGNSGTFSGAGIWASAEPYFEVPTFRPLIQGNTITNNVATRIGGGIGTWQRMAPEILDNYIANNEATEGDGGGIYFRALPDDTGAIIRGNVIENNYAGDHGGGFYSGSILPDPVPFELSWNTIRANRADGLGGVGNSGGGVWLFRTDAWVHHNTIVENTGNGPNSTYGGAIVIEKPSTPIIEKNIIALTTNGGGIWCGGGATPIIRNNLAWQNSPADGVGDCPDWTQANGNIVADPNFCGPELGDYSLAQNSPAITHLAGPLGALPIPGCGMVAVRPATWGQLKIRYK